MAKNTWAALSLAAVTAACVGDGAEGTGSASAAVSHAAQAPGQTGNTPGQGNAPPPGQVGATPNGGGAGGNGACANTSCDDGNPCTEDSCQPSTGCVHTNLPDGPFAGSTSTSCGVGACGATGQTVCASGAVVDSCAPGAAAASDDVCNGVDDDCDGAADEDYAPVPTTCGVGACGATGTAACVAGAVVDSCTPRPAPCEAPTVFFTTTPPASTSDTTVHFVWDYTGAPTTVRFTTSNGYDSGLVSSLARAFTYSSLPVGTYTLTVTAFNAVGSGSASYTWAVTPPPVGGARVVGWSNAPGEGLRTTDLAGNVASLNTTDTHIAVWSPDGQRVAYRSTAVRELWVQRADGTDKRNLSQGAGGVAINHLAWSPDSARLVFDVIANGYMDVWAVNADGSGLQNLTGTPSASEGEANFTPDGRIVYRNDADLWSIWTMDVNGANKSRLVAPGSLDVVLGRPLFSPDGSFLYAVNFQGHLLRFTSAGGGRTPISGGPVAYTEYALSPDGSRISFLRNNQVWVIDDPAGAATLRQLSTQSSGAGAGYQITTWSPDGATVVFDCDGGPTASGGRLCRIDAGLAAPAPASFVGFGQFQFPHWSGFNPARGG